MGVLENVAQFYADAALVDYRPTRTGGDVFIDHMPDTPNAAVAIMSGVSPPPRVQSYGYDRVGVQVIVRGTVGSRAATRARAEALRQAIAGLTDSALPDGTWCIGCFARESAPASIGVDAKDRPEYVINLELEVTQATALRGT